MFFEAGPSVTGGSGVLYYGGGDGFLRHLGIIISLKIKDKSQGSFLWRHDAWMFFNAHHRTIGLKGCHFTAFKHTGRWFQAEKRDKLIHMRWSLLRFAGWTLIMWNKWSKISYPKHCPLIQVTSNKYRKWYPRHLQVSPLSSHVGLAKCKSNVNLPPTNQLPLVVWYDQAYKQTPWTLLKMLKESWWGQ